MTAAYKKRAKGNWNQGKSHKSDSEERQHAKLETCDQLDDDTYLKPRKGKRKKNDKAALEYRISWYQRTIEKYGKDDRNGSYVNGLRDGLQMAQKEWREKYEK